MYKDPITDHGKISKKGRMTLELDESGKYVTKTEGTGDPAKVNNSMPCLSVLCTLATATPM